jgi:hypothetical protein
MSTLFTRFVCDEQGQDLIEYAREMSGTMDAFDSQL